jgi:hypothetical protein
VENDGLIAASLALSGVASESGDGLGCVIVSIKELSSGFVRILRGTSSRIDENVKG